MQTIIKLITPEIAAYILRGNTHNREINQRQVAIWAEAMRRGEWKLTHQGIAISSDGRLIDGQHRLLAIIKAGIALEMMVATDQDFDEVFKLIDKVYKRTLSHSTRLPKKTAEVCALFGRILTQSSVMISSDQALKIFNSGVGENLDWLLTGSAKNTKIYGSASARVAAIALMLDGHDKTYVQDLYSNLINVRVDFLPPIAIAFHKQVHQGRIHSSNNYALIARCLKVFDQKRRNQTKLTLATDDVENMFDFVKTAYYKNPEASKIEPWNGNKEIKKISIRAIQKKSEATRLSI